MTIEELGGICDLNGLVLTPEQLRLFEQYHRLLRTWNSRINLISRKDEENIMSRHILHSLTLLMPSLCDFANAAGDNVLDLGTGGGLPGIPVKIARPDLTITLVDSIQKKITACKDMVKELGLEGIQAVVSRAEELVKPKNTGRYDSILSRAVAPVAELIQWTNGLLTPEGRLYTLKGGDLEKEIETARKLRHVARIEAKSLRLINYPEFESEAKKIMQVEFK